MKVEPSDVEKKIVVKILEIGRYLRTMRISFTKEKCVGKI